MLYLSGPMSGYPDYNFPAFETAARALRELGHVIVSPHEGENSLKEGWEWADYLKRDLQMLVSCRGIVLMQGWHKSRGARLELHVALELGFEVHYLEVLLNAERTSA